MNELEMIRRIRRQAGAPPRGAALGIGDDCAVIEATGSNDDLVFTTDLLIENVHFRMETHQAADIGHKALARGLSDLAAMGAVPYFCLLSLAIPARAAEPWREDFFRGFFKLAKKSGIVLLGGDLARAGNCMCDIVCCGRTPRGKALVRSGARPDDEIWVSGRLGASSLGLRTKQGAAWRRHLRPVPRLELGIFLRERLQATAAMDLSDGLSLDLFRLCRASGVAAELYGRLPTFGGATLGDALHGGEDYELLFTVRPGTNVPGSLRRVSLTRIGVVRKGPPGTIRFGGEPLAIAGFDHFRG